MKERSRRVVLGKCLLPTIVLLAIAPLTGCTRVRGGTAEGPTPDSLRVAWLAEHAVGLRSIDPADTDFTDLEPVRRAIGGARLVLLGEASHGDGRGFLAKTRLIEFLHQQMGFDVVAFESGLYGCTKSWESFQSGVAAREAIAQCTFGLWSRSDQVYPLAAYIASHAASRRSLKVTGFDIQLSGTAGRESLLPDLERLIRVVGIDDATRAQWEVVTRMVAGLATRAYVRGESPLPSAADQQTFDRALRDISRRVDTASPASLPDGAVWRQIIEGLRDYAKMVWLVDPADLSARPADAEIREAGMTRTLLWLIQERFRSRKVIVWAATSHTARRLALLRSKLPQVQLMYDSVPTIGERVWHVVGNDMYSIGLTAFEGRSGLPGGQPWSIGVADSGSLEYLLRGARFESAFLDLRHLAPGGRWLAQPLRARFLGYQQLEADWTQLLDGVLFVRTMTPSTEHPTGSSSSSSGAAMSGEPARTSSRR